MEKRTHGFSAIVTLGVLGVLAIVAWLYKFGKNQQAQTQLAELTQQSASASPFPQLRSRELVRTANGPAPEWEYEVLMGCELVESRANDGNTFRIRHRENEYVFRLYFADAPETTSNSPDLIRDQTRYFDYITEAQLLKVGDEARDFSLEFLRQRPFTVFTRWEKLLQSHRYYGFIQVRSSDTGERRFLSELLAGRGFATLDGHGRKLPNGVKESVFREHLRSLEKTARKSRIGGWRDEK